jgi:hypothetical protein
MLYRSERTETQLLTTPIHGTEFLTGSKVNHKKTESLQPAVGLIILRHKTWSRSLQATTLDTLHIFPPPLSVSFTRRQNSFSPALFSMSHARDRHQQFPVRERPSLHLPSSQADDGKTLKWCRSTWRAIQIISTRYGVHWTISRCTTSGTDGEIRTLCPKSKCTDVLFKCILHSPEIRGYLLQSTTRGKLHSGSNVLPIVRNSTGSHFLWVFLAHRSQSQNYDPLIST